MSKQYKDQVNTKALSKLKVIQSRLPDYCVYYLNSINLTLSPRTQLAYAQDIEIFMFYLKTNKCDTSISSTKDISLDVLKTLTVEDIQAYLAFTSKYTYNGKEYFNTTDGKKRKLSVVRELYKYLCATKRLEFNPAALVRTPKKRPSEHDIRALNKEEKIQFVNQIFSEDNLSKKELEMKALLEYRDYAIVLIFLGTGIRVSELVGLDLDDLNMKHQYFTTIQKGGESQPHFFNGQIKEALNIYLNRVRGQLNPASTEQALFLSRRGTRIGVRSVEVMVKKFSGRALGKENSVYPHNLRSTYGTDLYAETGDIALVADELGHADVSTTKRYYAKQNIDNLRKNKNHKIF